MHAAGFFYQNFSQFKAKANEYDSLRQHGVTPYCKSRVVILRHDVDDLKLNSLAFARVQESKGISGSYYFRAVPESWDDDVIKEIYQLGHEVGYHYESLTTCNGNLEKAWDDFRNNLDKLRKLAPVITICMHGSPRSPWDSRDLWKKYDYRSLGILGEPYFDIDFNKFFYLTDTGRRWDGWRVSLRDKVPHQDDWVKRGWVFHSTNDIIKAINDHKLPHPLMMTFHPQRWTNQPLPWLREWALQNLKNQVKKRLTKISGETVKQ